MATKAEPTLQPMLQVDPNSFDMAGHAGEPGEPCGVHFVQVFKMPEGVGNPIGVNLVGCGRKAGVVSLSLTPDAARELAAFLLDHVSN